MRMESEPSANGNKRGPRLSGTILVVDDYECLGNLISKELRKAGYQVFTATGGEQAQTLAEGIRKLDLLVTDIEMPRMRGDELATWLARVHPEAKVIFVSSAHDRFQVLNWPHFVAKPFRITNLLEKVREVLEGAAAA